MTGQYAARLGVLLGLDTAELTVGVDKGISETKRLNNAIEREMKSAEKEILRIKNAVEDYGKEVTAVTMMQRKLAQGGIYENIGKNRKDYADAMLREAAAIDAVAAADKKLQAGRGGSAGMDRYLKSALAYQTTDIVTSLAGGQNPLMVLLQQGGQLRDQFGGFKPLFAGIAEAVTLSKVAFAGAATAVGAVAYGFYQGSKEAAKFRDDLILTNNYAGVTAQSFDKLSSSLSDKLNISVTDTKDIFSALVSSGSITRKNLEGVAEVIGNVARLSGESADTVTSRLLPAMDGSASSAMKLNAQYHFLSLAQYKHIEALNKQGKASEALNYQNSLLNASFEDQERKLGIVEKGWNSLLIAVGNVKNGLFSIGKEAGDSQLLDAAVSKLKTTSTVFGMAPSADRKKEMDDALAQYQALQDEIANRNKKAAQKSDAEAETQRKIESYNKAGGLEASLSIENAIKKQKLEEAYQDSLFGANEMEKINIESAKRIAMKSLEIDQQNATEKYNFSAERYKELGAFVLAEEKKTAQEKEKISRDTYLAYEKKGIAEKDSLDMEKQKMGIYQSNFFITEQEAKLAERRLETQQRIAEIMRDMTNGKIGQSAAEELIKQQEAIGKAKDEIINFGERLQYIKDINSAVFSSMTTAIEAFVLTGKFSMENFTKSILASFVQIQAKWMAMSMMRGLGSLLGGIGTAMNYGTDVGSQQTSMLAAQDSIGSSVSGFAAGGRITGPSIVGENGPELFIPSGAGTIIPNQRMNDYASGGAQQVFNGPYIANMQAIDTQSGTQFLAKNKMTIWSLNQSANRSVPAGR